jgi:hypothetical protein
VTGRSIRRVLLGVASASVWAGGAVWAAPQTYDLCADARVRTVERQYSCRTHQVRFQARDRIEPVQLAQIHDGTAFSGDAGRATYRYFLRTPEDEVIDLGRFHPWTNHIPMIRIERGVGVYDGRVRGASEDRHFELYEVLIEPVGSRYCLLYRMKPPFRGELRDCDGISEPQGEVGYSQGVVEAQKAWLKPCAPLATAESRRCETHDVEPAFTLVFRDQDSSLWYLTILRRRGPAWPPEFLVYRVHAESGRAEFVERTSNLPDQHKLEREYGRGGGLCNNAHIACRPTR